MEMNLTRGCIAAINQNKAKLPANVQVLKLKKAVGDPAENNLENDVFIISLSDSDFYINMVLNKRYNDSVFKKDIKANSIIQVDEVTHLSRGNKLLLKTLTILSTGLNTSIIGTPSPLADLKSQPSHPAPSSAPLRTPSRDILCQPINSLTQFLETWTIKVRVTRKSAIRNWENPRTKGKLFNFDVLDDHGGEINIVAFNKEVDENFEKIQVGKFYRITNGSLKPVTRSFNAVKNPFQIILNERTKIEEIQNSAVNISLYKFNFINSLEDVIYMNKDDIMDVCAVIFDVGELQTILTRKGNNISKISLTIADSSLRSIELVLWGSTADSVHSQNLSKGDIILIKGAKYDTYNDSKKLNTVFEATILINPSAQNLNNKNNLKVEEIKKWYNQVDKGEIVLNALSTGNSVKNTALTTRFTEEIDLNMLGMGDKPEWFYMNGIVGKVFSTFERPPFYESCKNAGCKKKVQQDANGYMFCSKCQMSFSTGMARYIFRFTVCDFTGERNVDGFDEQGKFLFGCEADTFKDLRDRGDNVGFRELVNRANWKEVALKCMAKVEEYNGESKIRVNAVNISEIDYVKEGKELCNKLEKMLE